MSINRRRFLQTCGVFGAGSLSAGRVFANDFPTRPLTIVAPYSAGGGSDLLLRVAGTRMAELLGKPVIVDNRPGASGMIAGRIVARDHPADGHTLFFGGPGHYSINPTLFANMSYDPTELAPVTIAGQLPFVVVVNPEVTKVQSFQELVEVSKRSSDGLAFGSTGVGTQPHLMMLLLARATGLRLKAVAYKGAGPVARDLVGGHVDVSALDFGTVISQLESGRLRALAVSSPQRIPGHSDIPTLAESGVSDFSLTGWYGFAVRTGTPPAVINRLAQVYADTITDPTVRNKIEKNFIQPISSTPQEFAALIQSETARYARVIKDANISLDK